jgi:hypothetical protein
MKIVTWIKNIFGGVLDHHPMHFPTKNHTNSMQKIKYMKNKLPQQNLVVETSIGDSCCNSCNKNFLYHFLTNEKLGFTESLQESFH